MSSHPQPRDHAEIDRTMNPPERIEFASLERPGIRRTLHRPRDVPSRAELARLRPVAAGRRPTPAGACRWLSSTRRTTWSPSSDWPSRRPTFTGSSSKARKRPSRFPQAARAAAAIVAGRARFGRAAARLHRQPLAAVGDSRELRRATRRSTDGRSAVGRLITRNGESRSRAVPIAGSPGRRRVDRRDRADRPIGGRDPDRGRRREDGISGRGARSRHAARRRSGHRLDQAGRDPLGPAGPAARPARARARATRLVPQPASDRRLHQPGSSRSARAATGAGCRQHPAPTADRADDRSRCCWRSVAEKTGYPAEMLELDMRLDADLGIDSIKRVEILSAIQDRLPELPPAGPEQLGTLGTLREIVAFLGFTWPLVRPRPTRGTVQRAHWMPIRTRRSAETDRRRARPASLVADTNGIAASTAQNGNGAGGRRARRPAQAASVQPSALSRPDDRDDVRLRAGGTVWITADGSPLDRSGLLRPGRTRLSCPR